MSNFLEAGRTGASEDRAVSVIIPVYNGAVFLGEAIESVLRQTLPVQEILVIDDGSTDGSAELARSYPGVLVLSFENAGLSTARNRGIAAATSPWVALLDSDDIWVPEKIERQMKLLGENPTADVCVTGYQLLQNGGLGKVMRAPEDFGPRLELGTFSMPSCFVLRRSALLAVGGFDPNVTSAEDWDCWLRLKRAGATFVSCPEPLMHYRRHGNNLTSDAAFIYRGDLDIFDRFLLPKVPAPLRPMARWLRVSRLLSEQAVQARENGQPGYLPLMLRSILMWPVGDWRRYKVAAHMSLKNLGLVGRGQRSVSTG
ncbi:Glycosyltransferase, GT2 family [Bryocella elongata]|uniref:Glycosyltransferase, GT2 family n=1 Tax=Bryocella elongata TaxID=863522 RepID=A0A1H5YB46_9BACT|nr:glycosyltransferase family A protein [Bryocella elongata]SEG20686.1 Glycosyltransferase, GT2 family [Bryocella elongata]